MKTNFKIKVSEGITPEAAYIHQIVGSGQAATQNFIDDNGIDAKKFAEYVRLHRDKKEKYDVRDIIAGVGVGKIKSFRERFIKQLRESKNINIMKKSQLQSIIREEVEIALGEQSNPELDRMVNKFVKGLAAKYGYKSSDAVMAVFEALKRLNLIHTDVDYKSPSGMSVAEGKLTESSYTSQMNSDTLELYREYMSKIDAEDTNAIYKHAVLDKVLKEDPRVQKNNQRRLLQQALGWALTYEIEMLR